MVRVITPDLFANLTTSRDRVGTIEVREILFFRIVLGLEVMFS